MSSLFSSLDRRLERLFHLLSKGLLDKRARLSTRDRRAG